MSVSYGGLGADRLPRESPRALLFYPALGIRRFFVDGAGIEDPAFKQHTINGDAVAIVQELNRHGFVVDACDPLALTGRDVDWERYCVVIDNWDNLRHAPPVPGQVRVHFANYEHWLKANRAELERIRCFRERTGITVPPARQLPAILSDEYADHLLYYGPPSQALDYSPRPRKFALELCGLCGPAPAHRAKDTARARRSFMWLGGAGLVHKGLDLVIEAFRRMPQVHLHVGGDLRREPRFWQWAEPILARHPNIHPLGWVDTTSPDFDALADACIGTVYASCSEGGPASVARLLFNGQIPIVTPSSSVRAQPLGYTLEGETDIAIIDSIVERVGQVVSSTDAELRERAAAVRAYAERHHTRAAFHASLGQLLQSLCAG